MKYDILSGESGSFTVNNTVKEVALAASGNVTLQTAGASTNFVDGDNVFLETVRIQSEYQFGHGEGDISFQLQWDQAGLTPILELSGGASMYLPAPMLEISPMIQLAAPSPGSGNFSMVMTSLVMNVSQLNVPALVNGEILEFQLHVVCRHTIAMV